MRAGGTVYPWDEWLDGRVWELRPAHDFPRITIPRFSRLAENVARGRGGRAVISTTTRGRIRLQMVYGKQATRQWQRPILGIRRFPDNKAVPLHRIVEMRESGMTYEAIAKRVGVSRQRIQQRLTTGEEGLTFVLIDKHALKHPKQQKGRRYGRNRGEL